MKLVISDPKTGKSWSKEISEDKATVFYGREIGNEIDGAYIDLQGYKLVITGGSDKDGRPMRKDIQGTERVKALLSSGPGFRPKVKGERRRKYLRGRTISDVTAQVNLKVITPGPTPLDEIFGKKEEKAEENAG